MSEELQKHSDNFKHELVYRAPHLSIKSTCKRCGASGSVLSIYDGSLEEWEAEHDCQKRPPVATLALLDRLRSWLSR
jgi:hypothetical protein